MFFKKLCLAALLVYMSFTSQRIQSGQEAGPLSVPSGLTGSGTEAGAAADGKQDAAGKSASGQAEREPVERMTNAQMARELERLGLHLPAELVEELDAQETDSEYQEIFDAYCESDPGFGYRMLLSWWGYGEYDDNWNWVPTSDQVYAFDCEVFNMSAMYTEFMNGVIAISGGEFAITDIEEDTSQVDYDKNEGKQILSFKYNGKPYTFEAEFYGDWLDCDVVGFMNDVFAAEGNPKRLLATDDGGQGCILFYNTPEWGKELEELTGMELDTQFW